MLNQLVDAVRHTGRLGIVGLYLPKDPGAPDENAANGRLLFNVGRFFEKGQKMGTGQADAKAYNAQLRDLIVAGRATPSFVVSKEVGLDEAPDAYARFDAREDGYSKVVLKP